MWKFKASKFKNAAPKVPRKEEWIGEVSASNLMNSFSNHITASATYMVFNTDSAGGASLGILPLDTKGRQTPGTIPSLRAHSEFVTDFAFSPFDDYSLATASQDGTVKLWSLPERDELMTSLSQTNPVCALHEGERRVDLLSWHPSAQGIIATASGHHLSVIDALTQQQINGIDLPGEQLQSMSWRGDGSSIVTASKDKTIRILDPRTDSVALEGSSHDNARECRVVWLGNKDLVVSSGFDRMRAREVSIRDCRNLGSPLCTKTYDTSTGVLIPLYDPDTGMLIMGGKGDTCLRYLEAPDKDILENALDTVEQVKGLCLASKRAMHVMQCEVNRVILLGLHCIIPIPYNVPRKSYVEFHGDLFPDTSAAKPALTVDMYKNGQNSVVSKMSLAPSANSERIRHGNQEVVPPSESDKKPAIEKPAEAPKPVKHTKPVPEPSEEKSFEHVEIPKVALRATPQSQKHEPESTPEEKSFEHVEIPKVALRATPQSQKHEPESTSEEKSFEHVEIPKVALRAIPQSHKHEPESASEEKSFEHVEIPKVTLRATPQSHKPEPETTPEDVPEPVKPSVLMREKKARFAGIRQSKFRHLQGTNLKHDHIENLRNLSKSVPGESDMFYANVNFCALPLGGSGGLVAILKTTEPGRLPDTGVPGLQNGSTVTDYAFDPFDNRSLAVGCDDAKIRLWKIPEDGLTETLTEPAKVLHGHTEKIYFVRYHPLASGVLASASYDMTIRIWDLETETDKITLQGHTSTIFSMAWSPDGKQCATVCKDGIIRLYSPRESDQPIMEGPGPEGTRGARIVWACDGKLLLVTGFNKTSERGIYVYNIDNLATRAHIQSLDTSPAILVPYYDEDSSTLFLTGRGENTVRAFEISLESPHVFPLSDYRAESLHQALAFLPKSVCDISKVEFARALRLTPHSIEPLAFSLPRVKTEYFQDDVYPDTKVTWEPALSGSEWFAGTNKLPKMISLKPSDMKILSKAPVDAPKPKKYESFNPDNFQTDDQKKEQLLGAMMGKFDITERPLPQDLTEGCEEEEWDNY